MNGIETIIWTIIVGMASGAAASLFGWWKTHVTHPVEEWDHYRFILTVLTGAVVGAIAAYMQISIDTAEAFLATSGAVFFVELAAKALYRWLKKQPWAWKLARALGLAKTPEEM